MPQSSQPQCFASLRPSWSRECTVHPAWRVDVQLRSQNKLSRVGTMPEEASGKPPGLAWCLGGASGPNHASQAALTGRTRLGKCILARTTKLAPDSKGVPGT